MIQRLQFESIFLWLLQRSSSRWLVVGTLLDVQGELLGHLLVINNLLLVLRRQLFLIHRVGLRLSCLLLIVLALDVWTLVLVLIQIGVIGRRVIVVIRSGFLTALVLPLEVDFDLGGVHVFLLLGLLCVVGVGLLLVGLGFLLSDLFGAGILG